MISFMQYAKGKQTLGEGYGYKKPAAGDLLFLFLAEPSQEERTRIAKDFAVHEKALESFAKFQHPKRFSSDPLSFVLIDYYLEKEEIKHTRIFLHLEKNVLIVAVPEKSEYYAELFKTIAADFMENGEERDITHLLYDFMETDTRDTYDILTKTEEKIVKIEEALISNPDSFGITDITKLKRFLFKMARRLWANAKIIFLIKKGLSPVKIDAEKAMMFDDVYDTFMHQIDIATSQREMLSDSLQIYATNLNNKLTEQGNELNNIMKRMTALTIIIMLPALIAGIYGMNFRNMPELLWPLGYHLSLLAMLLSALVSYALFKKYKYL